MRRSWIVLLFASVACETAGGALEPSPAQDAYYQIEANVFNANELRRAARKVEAAHRRNPDDPWVYLAASLGVLVQGYRIGDWYREDTFADGTLAKALAFAHRALELGPQESQTHAHLARIEIIRGQYETALDLLERSELLDSTSFYPSYFRGIAMKIMGDPDEATSSFDRAAERVIHSHQHRILNLHRQEVADLRGNIHEQERLLLENIRHYPRDPHVYGNYGHFLMRRGRYPEAVEYWQKAVDIAPYPEAVRRLEQARGLANDVGQ